MTGSATASELSRGHLYPCFSRADVRFSQCIVQMAGIPIEPIQFSLRKLSPGGRNWPEMKTFAANPTCYP
jgi:hypothetical protein